MPSPKTKVSSAPAVRADGSESSRRETYGSVSLTIEYSGSYESPIPSSTENDLAMYAKYGGTWKIPPGVVAARPRTRTRSAGTSNLAAPPPDAQVEYVSVVLDDAGGADGGLGARRTKPSLTRSSGTLA